MPNRQNRGSGGLRSELDAAYIKLKKTYEELKSSHTEMIFRMALMAEYRDPSTGIHLVRISDYSTIIAQGLGLDKKEIEILRYSSPMHDIGKIMLPDSILKNKGKLTPEERQIMERHPIAGGEIFRNARSSITRACGVIALSHHERYDGKGYPLGLSGEDIPLYGRIVALADCFDALTSKRSYKKAYDLEASVSMIRDMSGSHFDPACVSAFIKNREKIEELWEANRDIEKFLFDMGIDENSFFLDRSSKAA